ncbi:MAG: hypothetical protein PHH26_09350 [Candidatus Thermoplasmatota archaeon]|nr:hypothetical protein [Candidatus Thermoplasmatota archaeon]
MAQSDKVSEALEAHFKQWQEMGECIRSIVAPVLKGQEQFRKSLQPIIESQETFQNALESIILDQKRNICAHTIEFPKIAFPNLASLIKPAEAFKNSIERLISPAFQQLQKSFLELPQRTQETLILLGTHGWYLDLEMPLSGLWKLKNALTEGNVTSAEDALVEYFESRADEIEKSIVKRFPKRQKLIIAAFNAHRRQEYELSIPVLLAQTDGICKEVVNQNLFEKYNKKRQIAIYVEKFATDIYRAALLSPLVQTLPIWASKNERDKGFSELNRHMVIHGESLDYGTKTNSLKAISLINYVAHVLKAEIVTTLITASSEKKHHRRPAEND